MDEGGVHLGAGGPFMAFIVGWELGLIVYEGGISLKRQCDKSMLNPSIQSIKSISSAANCTVGICLVVTSARDGRGTGPGTDHGTKRQIPTALLART